MGFFFKCRIALFMGREEYNGVGSAVLVGGGESLCESNAMPTLLTPNLGGSNMASIVFNWARSCHGEDHLRYQGLQALGHHHTLLHHVLVDLTLTSAHQRIPSSLLPPCEGRSLTWHYLCTVVLKKQKGYKGCGVMGMRVRNSSIV